MDDSAREVILILSMSVSILPRSYSDGMSRDGLGITDGSVTAIGPVLDCSSFDIARGEQLANILNADLAGSLRAKRPNAFFRQLYRPRTACPDPWAGVCYHICTYSIL